MSFCCDDACFVDSTDQCRLYLFWTLEGFDVLGMSLGSLDLFGECRAESTLRQGFVTPVNFGLNDQAYDTSGRIDVVCYSSPQNWAAD